MDLIDNEYLDEDISVLASSHKGDQVGIGYRSGRIDIWSLPQREVRTLRTGTQEECVSITTLAWSYDDRLLFSGGDKDATVWDITAFCPQSPKQEYQIAVLDAAFSPDGNVLAVAGDTKIHLWHPLTGRVLMEYEGHASLTTSLAWSPDSQYIASGDALGFLHLWRVRDGQRVRLYSDQVANLEATTVSLVKVAFSPDGLFIAASYVREDEVSDCDRSGNVLVWEVRSGRCRQIYPEQRDGSRWMVRKLMWRDNHLFALDQDGRAFRYSASDGMFRKHCAFPFASIMAWLPDEREFVTAANAPSPMVYWVRFPDKV